MTEFNIRSGQLGNVLNELSSQQLIDFEVESTDMRQQLIASRITNKGFSLIQYKSKMKSNFLDKVFTLDDAIRAYSVILQIYKVSQQLPNLE